MGSGSPRACFSSRRSSMMTLQLIRRPVRSACHRVAEVAVPLRSGRPRVHHLTLNLKGLNLLIRVGIPLILRSGLRPLLVAGNVGKVAEVNQIAHVVRRDDVALGHVQANEIPIEVSHVLLTLNLRNERRAVLLLQKLIPIDLPVKLVPSNLLGVLGPTAQSVLRIRVQQPLQKVPRHRFQEGRHGQPRFLNRAKQLVAVAGIIGRKTSEHLVAKGAEGIPVDRLSVSLTIEDFRRKVFWRPAHGFRTVVVLDAFFR
mmetsp:Transcript_17233/g.42737  ORF Transcript_17233/g.42737 Transcript_17233/m.42737 type:complete len:257 (-) Transcript_17233:1769-2539(-)